ncbi:MAG: heme exporter protein CcmB [Rhodobacteraceae bacterium]|nr:heme exporter protein CcmB [Paracoccaceae bacterium]
MLTLITRDLRANFRLGSGIWLPLTMFLTIVVLIPIGIGPDIDLHSKIAPAILWIGVVFSLFLFLDRIFNPDLEDGSLDRIAASDLPLEKYVWSKIIVLWTSSGLLLTILAPFLGLLLNLPLQVGLICSSSILAGSPALAAIGCLGGGIGTFNRHGNLLQTVIVLPLSIPILIFGTKSVIAYSNGEPYLPWVLQLSGISLASIAIFPFLISYTLKTVLEE